MPNAAKLKSTLHQLVLETYDEQQLAKVHDFFQTLKTKEKETQSRLALKQMLAAQEGDQVLEFAQL